MNSYEQNNRDEVVKTLRDILVVVANGQRDFAIEGLDTVASMFRGLGYRFEKVHFLVVTAMEVYKI